MGVNVEAFSPTVVYEVVDLRAPVVPPDTWLNGLLKVHEMVTEQCLLLLVDGELDVVVVSHNKHDAFSCDSELLFTGEELGDLMRNGDIT